VTRFVVASMMVLGACGPAVSDPCETDRQCGANLTCDTTYPEGYCTRTPCRPGECPAEAVCVDFGADVRACMRTCALDDECREGLVCRSDLRGKPEALEGADHDFCSL
jgi:hypothetical protein